MAKNQKQGATSAKNCSNSSKNATKNEAQQNAKD